MQSCFWNALWFCQVRRGSVDAGGALVLRGRPLSCAFVLQPPALTRLLRKQPPRELQCGVPRGYLPPCLPPVGGCVSAGVHTAVHRVA